MLIKINLGHDKNYSLTYELQQHRVAQRIWERFQNNTYEYVSRTQFYNFGETEEQVRENLEHSKAILKKLRPELFQDSDNLNALHTNFPDLVQHESGTVRHELSMFNYHLHHLEDITRYKNKRFLLSTNSKGPGPEELTDADYDLFSPTRLTNHLYMNYPHVGKHIMEICFDNDVDIPADHIVPTHWLKNDLSAWFGKPQFENPSEIMKIINRFCVKISDKLPYPPGDKRLAIGHICLGKLTHEPDFDAITANQYLHSVEAI